MKFIEKRGDSYIFEAKSRELGAMVSASFASNSRRLYDEQMSKDEPFSLGELLYVNKIKPLADLYRGEGVDFPLILKEDELLLLKYAYYWEVFDRY